MYKHLFVPVDGSELSHRAMEGSIALAQQLDAKITGFVVEPDVAPNVLTNDSRALLDRIQNNEAKNDAHANALLGQFAEKAAAAGVTFVAHHVTAYMVNQAIVDEAQAVGADMIVIVTHGRNALGEFIFGSHTQKVIAKTQLPVLVLH